MSMTLSKVMCLLKFNYDQNCSFFLTKEPEDRTSLMPFPSLKIKITCLQYEASFLSTSQTKYCVNLTKRKYYFRSFHLVVKPAYVNAA